MKKYIMAFSAVFCLFYAVTAQGGTDSGNWVADKLMLYIPNRILDALDTFTVNVGVGPKIEAQMMATRAVWGGGGYGDSYKAFKAYNRQYGLGVESGWYWSFVFVGEEAYALTDSTSLVKKYIENRSGFPLPETRTYSLLDGTRDYWAIGGSLAFLVCGDVYIHPVEIADLVLGIFFIDIKGDDLTFADF